MHFAASLAILASATAVAGHGFVSNITIDNKYYVGYNPTIAPWVPDQGSIAWENWATDEGFVSSLDLQTPDIVCHRNATNSKLFAPIKAGTPVYLQWNTWPDSHHGPVMDYIANCHGDCTTVNKTTLEWIKIAEVGQLELGPGGGTPGFWGDDTLIANNFTWVVNIPTSLVPGNYTLRHEILALHSAYALGGAQFYPQCINLEFSSDGTDDPAGVIGTELYNATDPGILYNIYNDETDPVYIIPGPPLYVPSGEASE